MSSYHRNGYGTLDETGAPDVFLRGRLRIHGELFRVTVKKGHKPGLYTIKAWPAKSDPHKQEGVEGMHDTRTDKTPVQRHDTAPLEWRPGQQHRSATRNN